MRAALLVTGLMISMSACEGFPGVDRARETEPRLALALDMSDVLDWGAVSSIHLTLTNQGSATSRRAHVELYVPSWLEFTSVEPAGTEVSLLRSGQEIRMMYRLGDPALQPGESRTVVQRVRVPPRGSIEAATQAPPQESADSIPAADTAASRVDQVPGRVDQAPGRMDQAPANRLLRARLVSPEGEELGAEVRTVMPFRGADNRAALQPGVTGTVGDGTMGGTQPRVERNRVGPVQLGASEAELRAAAPASRDSTFTLGEGQQERGVAVPLAGGAATLALIVDGRVDRIIVRDPRLRTERGFGVGSTFQQLRQAYGRACVAPGAAGGTAVWFPNLPGISFAFDGRPSITPPDTAAALPDAAQVRELWVRRGVDTC